MYLDLSNARMTKSCNETKIFLSAENCINGVDRVAANNL